MEGNNNKNLMNSYTGTFSRHLFRKDQEIAQLREENRLLRQKVDILIRQMFEKGVSVGMHDF